MADLLAAKEAEHERDGWDNRPATLYWVGRDPEADGALAAAPCRLGEITGRHPREELSMIAQLMERPAGRVLHTYMTSELPPVAFALVMEAWCRSTPRADFEAAREEWRGRYFADMPGSVEVRMGLAVMGKHRMVLNRERGVAPEWMDSPDEWGGDMFEALVRLQAATRARTRAGT